MYCKTEDLCLCGECDKEYHSQTIAHNTMTMEEVYLYIIIIILFSLIPLHSCSIHANMHHVQYIQKKLFNSSAQSVLYLFVRCVK